MLLSGVLLIGIIGEVKLLYRLVLSTEDAYYIELVNVS
jgi:hypothetical protein